MAIKNAENKIRISDFSLYSIIAEHYGVSMDDVDIKIAIDVNGNPYIDYCEIVCTEPEREVSFTNHFQRDEDDDIDCYCE